MNMDDRADLSAAELEDLLATARESVSLGAKALREGGPGIREVTASAAHDVKIRGDVAVEEIILGHLMRRTSLPVLSEETGALGSDDARGLRWIVDPLDGTLNFSRELPLCCISIALWKGLEPLLGVIYDFNRDAIYAGYQGIGVRENGRAVSVSAVVKRSEAILLTGFPAYSNHSTAALSGFVGKIREYQKIRLLGTAALSLAYVASGKADAYEEAGIALWDVAAGLALVKAAGGSFRMVPNPHNGKWNVFASNGLIGDSSSEESSNHPEAAEHVGSR